MKITIDYEASWRNSFLDGSNDEALPNKKGRNFVSSMTELRKSENYHVREVSINTVLGLLSRLIGDQRKLYQAKKSDDYYFSGMAKSISFIDKPEIINSEITYIRNMNGSTDQNAFTGMIKVNDPIFQSDYSDQFWGVLALDLNELCFFIENKSQVKNSISLDPVSILNRLEELKKQKPIPYEGKFKDVSDKLKNEFEDMKPLNKKGQQLVLPMYCSALYLQLSRLERTYDMSTAKSKRGLISGISKNGFTPKDFMNSYTTGDKKILYGNPYVREEYVKGEGKIKHSLTKASGQLEINLDIDFEKAKELKGMIDNAGVSSFYLGKKGLAYVSEISLR